MQLPVSLPPLSEQKRIVEIFEKLLLLCEKLGECTIKNKWKMILYYNEMEVSNVFSKEERVQKFKSRGD